MPDARGTRRDPRYPVVGPWRHAVAAVNSAVGTWLAMEAAIAEARFGVDSAGSNSQRSGLPRGARPAGISASSTPDDEAPAT